MTLFVATSNPGKLRDFALAAASSSSPSNPTLTIEPLPGLDRIPAPEETESTFLGNATLKAVFYSRHAPGHIVLADDSGLEVDALAGAPGVRSARYASDRLNDELRNPDRVAPDPTLASLLPPEADTDTRNNLVLLHDLSALPNSGIRSARYRCSLVAARDGHPLASSDGVVEGQLLSTPRGSGGFGYDPLFLLPDLGLTMAEVDGPTRIAHSHRGRALRHLLPTLLPSFAASRR